MSLSRRMFLRGRVARQSPLRPPWAIPEDAFSATCTRCAACIDACDARLIVRGEGGFPEVNFAQGECTFCRACVASCLPQALSPRQERPWLVRAQIGAACLAQRDVVCRSCGDACEARAIRFRPRLGGAALPEIEAAACTGCGACFGACPAHAVAMNHSERNRESVQ